jgi:ferrochelatase
MPECDEVNSVNSGSKTAVVLINLGTPDAPTEEAVRVYLKEFLWDPKVVQIPRVIWWFILNFFVLRSRPAESAKAYAKVWTDTGSPLLTFSKKIQQKLQLLADKASPETFTFYLGMRYGNPSIASVVAELKQGGFDNVVVLPLYPQYATSSTGTALHAFNEQLLQWANAPKNKLVMQYFDDDAYINALASQIEKYWKGNGKAQLLMMSFHGVPEYTIKQGDPYLEHCTATAELLADKLGLADDAWQMVFQSRFGKAEWIKPYCVDELQNAPAKGVKSIDIVCPGFAADCLETLEEISLQNRDIFIEAGGEQYNYIPALNDSDEHIQALFSLIEKNKIELDSL